ncbi:MAG: hypothetical protein ACRDRA_09240 [Pseudonocardiaceae bacterium]
MTERRHTVPITCCLDGQAHGVTDECVAAGQHAGRYEALCGYVVSAAALVAPPGPPCVRCTVMSAAWPSSADPIRGSRHRQPGWLWRIFHPQGRR